MMMQESRMLTRTGGPVAEQSLSVRPGEIISGASVAADDVITRGAVREMVAAEVLGGERIRIVHHRARCVMSTDTRQPTRPAERTAAQTAVPDSCVANAGVPDARMTNAAVSNATMANAATVEGASAEAGATQSTVSPVVPAAKSSESAVVSTTEPAHVPAAKATVASPETTTMASPESAAPAPAMPTSVRQRHLRHVPHHQGQKGGYRGPIAISHRKFLLT